MIEAFELGVALTLETDAARAALNGVGLQLSMLDRDMSEFEKRMTMMPAALARLAVPQSSLGSENFSGRGEPPELSAPTPSFAPIDQHHLQSTPNLTDYLAVQHTTGGASTQGREPDLYSNLQPMFLQVTGSEGDKTAPMTTDTPGAVLPSVSDIMSQATSVASTSASMADMNAVSGTAVSIKSALPPGGRDSEFASQVAERGAAGNPTFITIAERGDTRSSALTGRDDPTSIALRESFGAASNHNLPTSPLQPRPMQLDPYNGQHVVEPAAGKGEVAGLSDLASLSFSLTSPSAWSAADAAASAGLPSDLAVSSGFILPDEMEANSAVGSVRGSTQSWGNSVVPPTVPYPVLPPENAAEEQNSTGRRGRTGGQLQDGSDEESMSNPLVIHTNVHIDGDVVARVVSEKMVSWMNGPLAGTGGFDARRSYTPVES